MSTPKTKTASQPPETTEGAIPKGRAFWWKLMDTDVGIIPLPFYLILIILLIAFTATKGITGELAMVIAISAVFAFTLGEIGNRLPLLRKIGGGAVLVTFIPSLLGYLGWVPDPMKKAVGDFFTSSKILNLFIAAVIVGSILSMNRQVLIKGFFKIFVPLLAGSVLAVVAGTAVGTALGLGLHDTFFFTVVPIMAGGVGEGAIPLTIGYSQILGMEQGAALARVLPPIMVGNLTAVILAGALALLGKKYPNLTGNGQLQAGGGSDDILDLEDGQKPARFDLKGVAAGGIVAVTLYLLGVLANELLGWPAPVVMLFAAVLLALAHGVSPRLQGGLKMVYRFALTAVAFPLLFTFSLIQTPWQSLVAGFAPANLITIVTTVVAMVAGGFFTARWVKLHPIETAMITSTHSGMGGAGDIAILTAADRMRLMPFAQIATRIGGGLTVAGALILISIVH
ncbi:2-hydroxycarboxylate transporter family protein [Pseudarthrobacter sp. NPDC058119]|uniref:2-hydroxycarboxylate transporter family protein n=1 Tax=Pseudarthrobacter sp. NPDC058119 TaxID=3346348 RepID=UPI0036DB976E